jgi:predicted protein tyrosine phosphatase
MKILCLCEFGSNRSVHFANVLKHVEGFETLAAGLKKNTPETLEMLSKWADVIVIVDSALLPQVPDKFKDKIKLYDVGPDIYPRPYNEKLLKKAKQLMDRDPINAG